MRTGEAFIISIFYRESVIITQEWRTESGNRFPRPESGNSAQAIILRTSNKETSGSSQAEAQARHLALAYQLNSP
jgi:hypothetical protein